MNGRRRRKRKEERAKEEKEKLEGEIADILRGVADLPNPKPTKAAQRWQMKEEEEMEYVRTASTQEIADILLDKTARMQAAVCASGDLGGDIVHLFRDTVASRRSSGGAHTESQQQLYG